MREGGWRRKTKQEAGREGKGRMIDKLDDIPLIVQLHLCSVLKTIGRVEEMHHLLSIWSGSFRHPPSGYGHQHLSLLGWHYWCISFSPCLPVDPLRNTLIILVRPASSTSWSNFPEEDDWIATDTCSRFHSNLPHLSLFSYPVIFSNHLSLHFRFPAPYIHSISSSDIPLYSRLIVPYLRHLIVNPDT